MAPPIVVVVVVSDGSRWATWHEGGGTRGGGGKPLKNAALMPISMTTWPLLHGQEDWDSHLPIGQH